MSSSKQDPLRPQDSNAQPTQRTDENLLERVLRETLAGGTIDPREMSALVDVGRRYNGQPLTLEPVAAELVEVILRHRLPDAVKSDGACRDMSQQIAASLLDTPETEERFRAFWARLIEAAR